MKHYLSTSPAPLVAERASYVAPSIEVIDVMSEGVIANSGGGSVSSPPGINEGGNAWAVSPSATANDIEDAINSILTYEE